MLCVPLLRGVRVVDRGGASTRLATRLLIELGAEMVDVALDDADAAIVDGTPTELRQRGLDPSELADRHPRLIVAAITPFGLDGPRAEWRTCDTVAQALGGMLFVNGHADEPPLRAFGTQAYHCAGLQAALGIALALLARARDGRGQVVDVSVHESVVASLEHVTGLYRERGEVATRRGTLHWGGAFRVAAAADGPVLLSHLGDWTTLLEWLRADGAAGDLVSPRYADEASRRAEAEHVFDVLAAWAARYPVTELIERAAALRLPFAPVWSVQRAARELGEPGAWLGEGAALLAGTNGTAGTAATGQSPCRPCSPLGPCGMLEPVLTGINVVDFTWVVAGPLATRVLADHGAEVVKIEPPNAADGAARRGALFGNLNRGKRSVAVDLNDARGRDLVRDLVAGADVVIDNFSPRVLPNFGLDAATLRARDPRLIAVGMSAFEADGAWADRVGYGPMLQAMAGFTWHMRHSNGAPAGLGFAYADMVAGYAAALTAVAALWRRDRGGGATLRLAQLPLVRRLVPAAAPDAAGNRAPEDEPAVPHGVFRCRDRDQRERWCALAIRDDLEWACFADLVGEAWAADAELASVSGRVRNAGELESRIAAWMRDRDADEMAAALQARGIAAGVVADAAELCARDPQLAARGYWVSPAAEDGADGVLLDGPMPRLVRTPGRVAALGPRPGEHTAEVLRDRLGLAHSDVEALRSAGVVR